MTTPAEFRSQFPEFSDSGKFPDAQVEFWYGLAEKLVSKRRFGDLWSYAAALFVAHNLVLSAQAMEAASSGGIPGAGGSGIISSKSVGSVSVGYDNGSAMEEGAGHWNATSYGRRYIDLVRLIGQGCYQL